MQIPKLIDVETIAKYKQISETVPDSIINQYIISAQTTDVRPLIGDKLYNSIIKNPEEHEELLEGGFYNYNGVEFMNYGLKAVIALFANSRYVYFGSNVDTPFSYGEKTDPNLKPTSTEMKKSIWQENRKEAMIYFENVVEFMERKEYSFYNCGCKLPDSSGSYMNINVISNE